MLLLTMYLYHHFEALLYNHKYKAAICAVGQSSTQSECCRKQVVYIVIVCVHICMYTPHALNCCVCGIAEKIRAGVCWRRILSRTTVWWWGWTLTLALRRLPLRLLRHVDAMRSRLFWTRNVGYVVCSFSVGENKRVEAEIWWAHTSLVRVSEAFAARDIQEDLISASWFDV